MKRKGTGIAVREPVPSIEGGSADQAPLFDWLKERSGGVLLHPTSLPGAQGIGTFDAAVDAFLDFLKAAGMRHWQLCPLGPTGYGDSPYQCFSAFAGNPLLIDLGALVEAGLLKAGELAPLSALPAGQVDYGALYRLKWPLLFTAYSRYARQRRKTSLPYGDFPEFRRAQAHWLDAYSRFRALKDHFNGAPWTEWPDEVRRADRAAGSALCARLSESTDAHAFTQYLFFGQWARVRSAARERGIRIIGDLPIFVAADSADAWSAPHLFELNPDTLVPEAVAGVPPDYFSADGQLWGNPLYRWPAHASDDYAWWRARLASSFGLYDVVRIDHFRGFDAYWRIPYPATNARAGEWVPGPGLAFFRSLQRTFPDARIIAEDLGILTESVERLLRATGLPGMLVLQFAFGGESTNPYLPHEHTTNAVVYPGTHDNDTTLGWYAGAAEATRDHVRRYLRVDGREIGWDFLRCAWESPARLAIVPLQDLLSLGSDARFNTPSRAEGNWQWRFSAAQLARAEGESAAYLAEVGALYARSQ